MSSNNNDGPKDGTVHQPNPPASAKKRQRHKLAAQEAEWVMKSKFSNRAKAVTPTLEDIQSRTFEEYVQHVLFDHDLSDDDDDDDDDKSEDSSATSWHHGVVKVTLPQGWWDQAGIANDTTARGPQWQKGTKLGDMLIPSPIQQNVAGIGGIYEFTLLEKAALTVSDYRAKADLFQEKQIGQLRGDLNSDDFCDALVRKFWKRLGPYMAPSMYGADMEGSLFASDPASGWSLQRLDNCLELLTKETGADAMPGVTTPYLYMGMWASVFCVHTEDMNLLSINYLHAGAPKYWYAIAPEYAKLFESLAESRFAHAHKECPQFLRHKLHLISPAILKKHGVPFTTQIQRPGDAIITCPGGYHFGVNLGFNVAEATNFAIPEWIEKGREAKICMCRPHSVRIDMDHFDSLLRKYREDTENAKMLGFPKLSYRRWTLLEASRSRIAEKSEQSGGTEFKKGTEFWIEVMIPLSMDGKTALFHKSKKRKKFTGSPREEWRLAKPLEAKDVKIDLNVLCLAPGKVEGRDTKEEQCFGGQVVEIVDGHCRVHFRGLKKEEDVWFPLKSPKLFKDGGKYVEPKEKVIKKAPSKPTPKPVEVSSS